MKAKLINVTLTEARGRFYARSEDMPGLYVSGYSSDEVLEGVPDAIRALYEADGIKVVVGELEDGGNHIPAPWVAVPLPSAA